MIRLIGLCVVGMFASACQTGLGAGEPVYSKPQTFIGRTVTVCGYISDGSNIYHRARDVGRTVGGLSIVDRAGVLPVGDYRACVVGHVIRTGCESEYWCLGRMFEYGIEVSEYYRR